MSDATPSVPGMSQLPLAYPVPWLLIREHAPTYGLRNASLETLKHVWVTVVGPGTVPDHIPRAVAPGETLWVPVLGDDLAWDSFLHVRWRRSDGSEYLWRAVF